MSDGRATSNRVRRITERLRAIAKWMGPLPPSFRYERECVAARMEENMVGGNPYLDMLALLNRCAPVDTDIEGMMGALEQSIRQDERGLAPRAAKSELVAQHFHDTYERLAPEYGYKTRSASAVSWNRVPEANRRLMIAVAAEVLRFLDA